MTVVCAIRDGSVVLMSADSIATSECGRISRSDSKMFLLTVDTHQDMLVGFCGEYARFQLMKCTFRPPPHNKQRYGDSWNYLVGQFVPALRDFFMKYFGDDRQDHNMFSDDSELLIAFNGRIFTVFGDGQVQENLYEFAAIGSCDAAMGAMHALSKSKQALSWDILDAGMQAAKEFSSNVGAPFETRVLFKAL